MKSTGKTMSIGITAPVVAGFGRNQNKSTLKRKCQR